MSYNEFLDTFDVIEYLSNAERQEASGQKEDFEKKLREIKDMESRGFKLISLKIVGEIWRQGGLDVPFFFEMDRFAYRCGDGSSAYANVAYFFARKINVQDKNGEDVYESPTGQRFVIHYEHGSLRYLPYYKLRAPRWL